MKILLINPPYINFSGIKESGGHTLPLNLAYLAGYARKYANCQFAILDAENFGLSYEQIKEKIEEASPNIVGITCPSPSFNHVKEIARIAKGINPEIKVVLGGPHPTAFPREVAGLENIDFVVRGEGESTFTELIKALQSRQPSFQQIPGLAFKAGGQVLLTAERSLIENLDEIPFPARDLFDLSVYDSAVTKKVSRFKSTSIITSRGCPYDCIHCISKLVWRRQVRYRSLGNIMAEMEECVKRFGIGETNFYDDTFTIDKKRVIQICRAMRERKLNLSWICFGRVNTIDRELVEEMKLAGCKKVSFGLESGSQRILDLMRKNATIEMARQAVEIVDQAGLNIHASFMLGNVGETAATVRETINFAKSLPLDNATFFITAPFPGTDLYKIALAGGYINEQTHWEDFAPITKSAPVLVQGNLSQAELISWQKKAFREFYLRSKYIFRKLSKITSWTDFKIILIGLGIFFRVQKKKIKDKHPTF